MHLWLSKQHKSTRDLHKVSSAHILSFRFSSSGMEIYARISCFLSNAYRPGSTNVPTALSTSSSGRNDLTPLVQCTNHMCPIRIHWHVKINYKAYWRVKVTITNFNYRMNYSQWNLVVQHPNFDNLTQIFSFNYQPITPYESISKPTLIFCGTKIHL